MTRQVIDPMTCFPHDPVMSNDNAIRTTAPTTTTTTTSAARSHDAPRSTAPLQAWSLAMVAFGLAIAAVPWVRIDLFSWVARGETDLTTGFSEEAREYLAFNQSLMGALTAGLGIAALWFARLPIARREPWGWYAFASAIGTWFVIDNVASVATGYPRNVALNLLLAAPLVPLLWSTRPGR
jgi:hypothetical protein